MEDQILIFGESEQPQRVRKGFHLSIKLQTWKRLHFNRIKKQVIR